MNRPQRLFELDALRGMSLLGIVLMNILIFSFPYDNIDLTKHLSGFDVTIIRSVKLIIISSFYPIFTFHFRQSSAYPLHPSFWERRLICLLLKTKR